MSCKKQFNCSSFGFPLQRCCSLSTLTGLHAVKCLPHLRAGLLHPNTTLQTPTFVKAPSKETSQALGPLTYIQTTRCQFKSPTAGREERVLVTSRNLPAITPALSWQKRRNTSSVSPTQCSNQGLESSASAEFLPTEPKASACESSNNQVSSIFPLIRHYISTHKYFKVALCLAINSYCYRSK